jgi:hypothetical protein
MSTTTSVILYAAIFLVGMAAGMAEGMLINWLANRSAKHERLVETSHRLWPDDPSRWLK